jgi:hypothetical protein
MIWRSCIALDPLWKYSNGRGVGMPNLRCVFFPLHAWFGAEPVISQDPLCKCKGYKEYAAQVCRRSASHRLWLLTTIWHSSVVCNRLYSSHTIIITSNLLSAAKVMFPFRTSLQARHVIHWQSESTDLFPTTRVYLPIIQQEESEQGFSTTRW